MSGSNLEAIPVIAPSDMSSSVYNRTVYMSTLFVYNPLCFFSTSTVRASADYSLKIDR